MRYGKLDQYKLCVLGAWFLVRRSGGPLQRNTRCSVSKRRFSVLAKQPGKKRFFTAKKAKFTTTSDRLAVACIGTDNSLSLGKLTILISNQ